MARRGGSGSKRRSAKGSTPFAPSDGLRLSPIADLRTWHPESINRPILDTLGRFAPLTIERSAVRIGVRRHHVAIHRRPWVAYGKPLYARRGLPRGFQLPYGMMVESPLRVGLCIRRAVRRRVLFARRKTGRGARQRRRRRDWRSNISC